QLDRVARQVALLVLHHQLDQARRAGERALRQAPLDPQLAQDDLARDSAQHDQAQQEPEHQVEEVVARVDRRRAHTERHEDEDPALSREAELARARALLRPCSPAHCGALPLPGFIRPLAHTGTATDESSSRTTRSASVRSPPASWLAATRTRW